MFARILGRFFKINPSFPSFISFVLLRWKILLWRRVGDMINCFRERCINWFGWKIKIEKPEDSKIKNYIFVSDYCIFVWVSYHWKFLRLSKYRNWSNNEIKHRKVFSFFFLKVRLSRFLFSPYFKDFFFYQRDSHEYEWILLLLSLWFFSLSIFSTFIFHLIFIIIYYRFSFLNSI